MILMGRPQYSSEKPPLSVGRTAGQLVAGVLGGIVGGVIGLIIGAFIGGNFAEDFEFAGLRGYEATGIIGFPIGVVFGSPQWVYLIGRLGKVTASYGATLTGGILGAILVVGALYGVVGVPLENVSRYDYTLLVVTPLGAMLGFELTRRYKQPTRAGSA